MAVILPGINDQVKQRLPFLLQVVDANILIEGKTAEAFAELAPQSKKTEPDIWEETTYTPAERVFFAAYTAYKILLYRVAAAAIGDGTLGNVGTGNKLVTEATVDVLTTKFDIIKSSDKDLGINTMDLLSVFQKEVCSMAYSVGYDLPFCGTVTSQIGFKFIELDF